MCSMGTIGVSIAQGAVVHSTIPGSGACRPGACGRAIVMLPLWGTLVTLRCRSTPDASAPPSAE